MIIFTGRESHRIVGRRRYLSWLEVGYVKWVKSLKDGRISRTLWRNWQSKEWRKTAECLCLTHLRFGQRRLRNLKEMTFHALQQILGNGNPSPKAWHSNEKKNVKTIQMVLRATFIFSLNFTYHESLGRSLGGVCVADKRVALSL